MRVTAKACFEKKSKRVIEIQEETSRGGSADELLDGMLAAFEDDKKQRESETEGRYMHCGALVREVALCHGVALRDECLDVKHKHVLSDAWLIFLACNCQHWTDTIH